MEIRSFDNIYLMLINMKISGTNHIKYYTDNVPLSKYAWRDEVKDIVWTIAISDIRNTINHADIATVEATKIFFFEKPFAEENYIKDLIFKLVSLDKLDNLKAFW